MSGNALSYFWDFDDGQFSSEKEPLHTYRMPGTYLVTLTVGDKFGNNFIVQKYVYVYQWDLTGNELNVSTTDRCYRYSTPQYPEQGSGWSIYDGERWPHPEGIVGTLVLLNKNEEILALVIDSINFKTYIIGKDDEWLDGAEEYIPGVEIESEILFKEQQTKVASSWLEHSQTHINIKPWYKEYRHTVGYNEEGFKTSHYSDLYIRANSKDSNAAITKRIPLRGQLVYDRHLTSKYLQQGIIITGAPWRLVSLQQWFKEVDEAGSPKEKLMNEYSWSYEFREPIVWFPRTKTAFLNYATGDTETGSNIGFTTGPDGYNSAYVFGLSDYCNIANIDIGSVFSLHFWLKTNSSNITILTVGVLTISINSGVLNYNDGINNINITLRENYSGWVQVVLIKNGTVFMVYENKVLANTAMITNLSYSGGFSMFDNACHWSDYRIIPRALSYSALEYSNNDFVENNGNVMCPIL